MGIYKSSYILGEEKYPDLVGLLGTDSSLALISEKLEVSIITLWFTS